MIIIRRRERRVASAGASLRAIPAGKAAKMMFMRFGLGPKPNGATLITSKNTVLHLLKEEVETYDPAIDAKDLEPWSVCFKAGQRINDQKRSMAEKMVPPAILKSEYAARYAKQLEPSIGFVERLVMFWSNHFSVYYKKKSPILPIIGHYERTTIRPHVLGKFSDMLRAAIQHPAMMMNLDNEISVGNNSRHVTVLKNPHCLNENLAREILELHTLGADGGYTQGDVEGLAKILTGWKYDQNGNFMFSRSTQEPGQITFMGQTYAPVDKTAGENVLDLLASKPATALHIARKLVKHFITDNPTSEMVTPIAKTFVETGGDLKNVSLALLELQHAWEAPMDRIRPPHLWLVSQLRTLSVESKGVTGLAAPTGIKGLIDTFQDYLVALDNQPWFCQTPDGYPDDDFAWATPNSVRLRSEITNDLLSNVTLPVEAAPAFVMKLLPEGALSKQTIDALTGWSTPAAGFATLFMSPEFMRR